MSRFLRFAIVGCVGFAVDAGLLAVLLWATPLGPFLGRLVSIACGLTVTWLCNRTLTFGPSGRSRLREGARYGGVGIASSIANYLVYSGVLLAVPQTPPVAAVVVASLAAMILSYLGYSRLVFDR
ncbi:MAG: GtrA family protein [Hyphomicrobiales bacterium]|nr:GtrA family protein [Hyphomicrobiales bacterium]